MWCAYPTNINVFISNKAYYRQGWSVVVKYSSDVGFVYVMLKSGGGGYSHVEAYGDVPPKWVSFSPKILNGHSLVTKILRSRVPFHQNCEKN